MESKIYLVCCDDKTDVSAVTDYDVFELETNDKLSSIERFPFECDLKKIRFENENIFFIDIESEFQIEEVDYLPNVLAWPIFSEKLKNIIDQLKSTIIKWIEIIVNVEDTKILYFVPLFNNSKSLLDHSKTKFVPGTDQIIKPVFKKDEIEKYDIFHLQERHQKITSRIYCTMKFKEIIDDEKIKGILFE